MKITEHIQLDSPDKNFTINFSSADFSHITELALTEQLSKMIQKIIDRLTQEFLDQYRPYILSQVSILDILERVKNRAGEELVKGIINKDQK